MKNLSTDKIAVIGLVCALILSICTSVYAGSCIELQTTIAGGLVGYIGKVIQENHGKEDSK